jgi:predicted glycoside hydrolase/deacetylase ChbG (UPF0249 family)
MLIINADDWGRSEAETDSALKCYKAERITSVSAMLFMADSERAADLAKEGRLTVGLHLNFSEPFTGTTNSPRLNDCHRRTVNYLKTNKYAQLIYNPLLRKAFSYSCLAQLDEFRRLYQTEPSHIDGHHHMHLCANMLFSGAIPAGMRMRRNFSFWPGEKSLLNRVYRALVDRWIAHKYWIADYFFDLTQCLRENKLHRVAALAKSNRVELMTHPVDRTEADYLASTEFYEFLQQLDVGSYALV